MNKQRLQQCFLTMLFFILFAAGQGTAYAGTVAFSQFTALSGLTVTQPFNVQSGTQNDPDTVTVRVTKGVSTVSFRLTVEGKGFSNAGYCELDWDDDAPGVPYDSTVTPQGGSFTTQQVFTVPVSRLGTGSAPKTVVYELDADEEPYDVQGDVKRYLRVVFTFDDSTGPIDPDSKEGSGSGCNAGFSLFVLGLGALGILSRKKR